MTTIASDTAAATGAAAPPVAPFKPFRARVVRFAPPRPDVYRLLRLEDGRLRRLGMGMALAMALILAGTVTVGPTFTFLTLIPVALTVIVVAVRDPWTALLLYIAYSAMEGMYKYLAGFATAVYLVGPFLMGVIAVTWGLSRQMGGRAQEGGGEGAAVGAPAAGPKRIASAAPAAPLAATTDAPRAAARRGFSFGAPAMGVTAVLFCMVAFLQSFNPGGSGMVSGLATAFLWYIGPLLMLFVTATSVRSSRQVIACCYVLLCVGAVVSAFALVQYLMGRAWTLAHLPGYETAMEANWDAKTFRPASTTAMSGGGATWAHFAVGAGLVLLFSPNVRPASKVAIAAGIALNGVSLLLSAVRVYVFIDLLTIPLFLILLARSPREMIRSLAGLLAATALIYVTVNVAQSLTNGRILNRYQSTAADPVGRFFKERGNNLEVIPALIEQSPFGVGYQRGLGMHGTDENGYGATGLSANRETQFACWQGDLGLPGLILGTTLILQGILQGWRAYRVVRLPHLRPFATMLFCLVLTYAPGCFLGPSMQGAVTLWTLTGLLVALPQIERAERAAIAAAVRAAAAAATPRRGDGTLAGTRG